jgi:hypothetical protein
MEPRIPSESLKHPEELLYQSTCSPLLGAVDWLIADCSRALTLLSAFRRRSQFDSGAVPDLTGDPNDGDQRPNAHGEGKDAGKHHKHKAKAHAKKHGKSKGHEKGGQRK